jgi:hypothetical protein
MYLDGVPERSGPEIVNTLSPAFPISFGFKPESAGSWINAWQHALKAPNCFLIYTAAAASSDAAAVTFGLLFAPCDLALRRFGETAFRHCGEVPSMHQRIESRSQSSCHWRQRSGIRFMRHSRRSPLMRSSVFSCAGLEGPGLHLEEARAHGPTGPWARHAPLIVPVARSCSRGSSRSPTWRLLKPQMGRAGWAVLGSP